MKKPDNEPLVFAALKRVSTEKQQKDGESLASQKNDIENAAGYLVGKIACWYGGQEHATPGHEKREIDRLLQDATDPNRKFNAVIVAHADRWSRDNEKSREGLDIFRKQGIRFFVNVTEQDLFSPEHCLFLEMSAAFGQFQARQQNMKSLKSRILRAKSGRPTSGKLPYGRVKDPVSGKLVADPDKKRIIQEIAVRYIAGESLAVLAVEYRINHSYLLKVLNNRCGSEWKIEFRSDSANIHEIVSVEMEPLLDADTIADVKARVIANRSYTHRAQKNGNQYLLGRMIFCAHCGYALTGQAKDGRKSRYYRHCSSHSRNRKCTGPDEKPWIRADELERTVLEHLFDSFGNPLAVQRAIEDATPNLEQTQEAEARIERLTKSLAKIQAGRNGVVRLVSDGALTLEHAKPQLARLDEREAVERAELETLQASIAHLPTPASIKAVSAKVAAQIESVRGHPYSDARLTAQIRLANHELLEMTEEDKRALVQLVFGGKRPDGSRMGVYIEWVTDGRGRSRWKYTLHGHLVDEAGWLPLKGQRDHYEPNGAAPQQRPLVTNYAWRRLWLTGQSRGIPVALPMPRGADGPASNQTEPMSLIK